MKSSLKPQKTRGINDLRNPRTLRVVTICLYLYVLGLCLESRFGGTTFGSQNLLGRFLQWRAINKPPVEAARQIDLLRPLELHLVDIPSLDQCAAHFGDDYIKSFSQKRTLFCDSDSEANLTCFSNRLNYKETDDTFCISDSVAYSRHDRRFRMNCTTRDMGTEELERLYLPQPNGSTDYWYMTGPDYALKDYVDINGPPIERMPAPGFNILIKRERSEGAFWNEIMEIMSLTISIDVLSTTMNENGQPYFTEDDRATSQVVFLDNEPPGPHFDLWGMFTGLPFSNLEKLTSQDNVPGKMLLPLQGHINPFWIGVWAEIPCSESSLLKRFTQRVLDFYGVSSSPLNQTSLDQPLRLTFIVQRETRPAIRIDYLSVHLRDMYPDVQIHWLYPTSSNFAEVVERIHNSDFLLSEQGAALIRGMFLPANSAVIEIGAKDTGRRLPEIGMKDVERRLSKMVAKLLGHDYHIADVVERPVLSSHGILNADEINEHRVLEVIDVAVTKLLSRRSMNAAS